MYYDLISSCVEETHKIANNLIKKFFKKYKIIFLLLYGNLGSGKTEFVKGIATSLKISKNIKSPSFIIINEVNKNDLVLFHIDLYRIDIPQANKLIKDFLEELNNKQKKIFCIEWSEKLKKETLDVFKKLKNSILIKIKIKILKNNKRKINIKYEEKKQSNNPCIGHFNL